MIRALYSAASGLEAQQLNIDVIANNLANVNTAGFKLSRAEFEDLLYQNLRASGAASSTSTDLPVGLQVGLGSRPVATSRLFTQGEFRQTGNPLDFVIEGQGFFQVRLPSGETAYTRAGSFHLNREGSLVTAEGNLLDPQVTIPADAQTVTVGSDGTVSVTQPGQAQAQQVGTIQLATFPNPAGLNSIGKNLFLTTSSSGEPITGTAGENGIGTINQGFVEQSNVNVVEEMVNMIVGQRAYEINSKVVKTADEMLQTMNNVVR
ncbi:MAG: flagellar basal-body rod protein FlgG [Acidobacteria bacterium]|nr:MAG: flagellar basal-body rod protein FlgG [Acidobacteriota bacterium]